MLHLWTISLFWTGLRYDPYTNTNCYFDYTILIHRPYTLDIKVIILSFFYLPYVEFTHYRLTFD